ncbi:MAG TPA: molybdopterin cofactor-binding domain-containing protein, partial [Candidatus Krumholzibacteria bacterium]|nr:molybdopterin cofactor-binding domain-containing protein [Candidatus Krumholzibacteria bacterium]
MASISFTLNGTPQSFTSFEGETLMQSLRERFGMLSIKNGCAPQGQCGACLALIDGKAKTTCAIPVEKADGKEILTLEGIGEENRRLIARCFTTAAGLQCGFCIPGIALRTHWLLERNPDPSREEIAKSLDAHLCRCTGYLRIFDAIEMVAKARRGEAVPKAEEDGHVGKSLRRWHGEDLSLGMHEYVDDMKRPGMLYGAVTLSKHPRARVKSIDTSKARALPGVVKVFTAADVPGNRWYGLILNDWPGLVAQGEEVRCVGDMLAIVAADSEATARAAARLVEVDYEVLKAMTTTDAATAEGAPRVNPTHDNLLSRTTIKHGDTEKAFAAAAHVVEGHYQTQRIEHLYLEPEACLAEPREDGGLRFFTQGQGVFDDRRQVAAFLNLPEDKVEAVLAPNGGAFGGKEDMSIQAQTALITHLTGRPAKITLNREESIRIHPKRHPIAMDYKVACDEEGHLLAVRARMTGDTGAYASVGAKVLERAAGHSCGAYRVPNVDIVADAVTTNNPPCGAMRGFGANQAHFAMEGCMDLLAEKCGLDAWEMRWRNALQVGDTTSTGQILEKSVGLKKTLSAVKDSFYAARKAG